MTETEELLELLREYNMVTASTICSLKEGTLGYAELDKIRKKVAVRVAKK